MNIDSRLSEFASVRTSSTNQRWGALPLTLRLGGPPSQVRQNLPVFQRADLQQFGLRENSNLDMIIKGPEPGTREAPTPVGLVSKTYSLIQHVDVFDLAVDFVSRIGEESVKSVDVAMSANGERFSMQVHFGEKFRQSPDGNDVGLQLLCRNAVDGTAAVRANLGWFRFVCSNGMTVGLKLGSARLPHTEGAHLSDIFGSLEGQVLAADVDRKQMTEWVGQKVSSEVVCNWADTAVAEYWGPLAACRVWHICNSGQDAAFIPPFRKIRPSQKNVRYLGNVAGSFGRAENVYAVAQALSWVSSHRGDTLEAEAMTRSIPRLLAALRN